MGRPLRIEYNGAFYHVTSRGNEQKDVFKSRADREIFGARLREIGGRFDISDAAVTQASRRFAQKLKRDEMLRKRVEEVEKLLNVSRFRTDT